jgi:hypothetical protein
MEVEKAIEIYERLRVQAQKNVASSSVEHLSMDLCECLVVNNPDNRSQDIVITISVNGVRKTFTVPVYNLRTSEIIFGNSRERIVFIREISKLLRQKIAEQVAELMSDDLFKTVVKQIIPNGD